MLSSVLISLSPVEAVPILGPLSRPIQAWFLGRLALSDPVFAQTLHDDQGLKPFTVSTLLDERGRTISAGRWLKPGESLWLRITTINPSISSLLTKKILPNLPNRLNLYKMSFRVEGYTFNPAQNHWAGQSSYQDLAQSVWQKEEDRRVRLEFASPTAFRNQGADISLPIPGQVFRSLWEKWNRFAPEALHIDEIWPEFASACVLVCEMTNINTDRWSFAEGTRGISTGFTGAVAFTLLPQNKCNGYGQYWEGASQVLRLLSSFAYYCGVGHHTTLGMGQVRILPNANDEKRYLRR